MSDPVLEAVALTKRFGPTVALHGVSFAVNPGEVHALLGENGAGKSTLVSVLSGGVRPDAGLIRLNGEPVTFSSPRESRERGVAVVHQHFALIPAFSVAENLLLSEGSTQGVLPKGEDLVSGPKAIAEKVGWRVDFSAKVRDLSVGEQQRVEIIRALSGEVRAVLFDEPTATLTPTESDQLFDVIRSLRDDGVAIVLITHKLREVMQVADVVTVLRSGVVTLSAALIAACSERMLAESMVGEVESPSKPSGSSSVGALEVRELKVRGDRGNLAVNNASFSAAFGSILGVAGVDGNGQVELAEAIFGIRPIESGGVQFDGVPADAKIAYIPQDRLVDGLAPLMSVAENLMIEGHKLGALRSGLFVSESRSAEWRRKLIEQFEIKCENENLKVESLSGGNQQKVLLARLLDERPDVVIAVDPTRGLDIRAAAFVRDRLVECATRGSCVILFSTDLEELQSVSNRMVVMSGGRISEGSDVGLLMGGVA